MSIYEKYEERGLLDYKLKTVYDVRVLHGTEMLNMKGLDNDSELVIRLFIGYLSGCGCNNRQDVLTKVDKLNIELNLISEQCVKSIK